MLLFLLELLFSHFSVGSFEADVCYGCWVIFFSLSSPFSIRADPFLYTITTDDVVRLWSPVIDDPMWFQMVWSLGMRQYGIGGIAGRKTVSTSESSSSTSLPCFIVDYPIIRSMSSDTKISSKPVLNGGKWKAGVEDELEEVICWCEEDGSLWKATLPVSCWFGSEWVVAGDTDNRKYRKWKGNLQRFYESGKLRDTVN